MARRSRKPIQAVDPATLYSLDPLSDEEQQLLRDAELVIRRWSLRRKILPEEHINSWAWSAFIESLAMVKGCIEIGIPPRVQGFVNSEETDAQRIVAKYKKTYGAISIDYTAVLDEVDRLHANGISAKEMLFRLQGEAAKPRARYAESFAVEASGLFDVKAVHA